MKQSTERGSILVTILVMAMFFGIVIASLAIITNANVSRARQRLLLLQAQYSAESGADVAIATLNSGNTAYTGTTSETTVLDSKQYRSTFTVSVAASSTDKERVITATGYVYSPRTASAPTYTRKIRVSAQRSSTETASSIVSRNIVETSSGVKNIVAKSIHVNGFIQMNKNTTNLVAENITVAGKNTSASKCSIGGTGNLVKPAAFSDPAQTKTNITLGYNNCITPPGNSTNTNFTVAVNQPVAQVQSLYIPWGQFMDNTYAAAGSCNDWTTGGSVRTLPSVPKKTHYPDSATSISTTCGTSGDINLGSNTYVISDNIHLRANLCAASACTPTFYNPTSAIRYVFIEGTINFGALNTTSGSGPIVFITYGADPGSKASTCPYGGSLYIGQSGSTTTHAPQVYLLAMNGVCLDKTKFGGSGSAVQANGLPAPALGGIGGKNIYVATNPGSPWDLALDPAFPTNLIPIDLSWREASYERL